VLRQQHVRGLQGDRAVGKNLGVVTVQGAAVVAVGEVREGGEDQRHRVRLRRPLARACAHEQRQPAQTARQVTGLHLLRAHLYRVGARSQVLGKLYDGVGRPERIQKIVTVKVHGAVFQGGLPPVEVPRAPARTAHRTARALEEPDRQAMGAEIVDQVVRCRTA